MQKKSVQSEGCTVILVNKNKVRTRYVTALDFGSIEDYPDRVPGREVAS